MSDRRGFLTVITGGLMTATVPFGATMGRDGKLFPVRDANGMWPDDLFPPGHHPRLDYKPDETPLLEACSAFDKLECAYVLTFDGQDVDETSTKGIALALERHRIEMAQEPLVDVICDSPAVTLAGLRAKARSLALYDEFAINVDATEHTDRLRTSLLQDILGSEMPKIAAVQTPRECEMERDFLVACRERPGDVVMALRQLYVGQELPASVLGVIPSLERRQVEIDRGV